MHRQLSIRRVTHNVLKPMRDKGPRVGTKLGTVENEKNPEALEVVGAKGGTRTPTVLPARS
jgi:hypothetical protein